MLREVNEREFFAALTADKRDIMPTITGGNGNDGYESEWRTRDCARTLFGRTFTGVSYRNIPARWYLDD